MGNEREEIEPLDEGGYGETPDMMPVEGGDDE